MKTNLLKSIFISLILLVGTTNAWAYVTYYLKSDNTTWDTNNNGWGFTHNTTTTTYMANGSKFKLWRTDWGSDGWFGVNNSTLKPGDGGLHFKQYENDVQYNGPSGMVCFHMDQAGNNSDSKPWVWITRPTFYLKHNWSGGAWTWKALTDNQDGTYQLTDYYGGTTLNYGDNNDNNSNGWASVTASTTGTLSTGKKCIFVFNSANKTIAITRLYTITYNGNGHTGGTVPAAIDKKHGTSITLSSSTPTRTGYTFAGWNTKADGSGTNYAKDANYSVDADVTLYAKWTPVNYTITYNTNGGSGTMTPTSYTIETATFNLPTPTKTGYTFAGWYTKNDFSDAKVTHIEKGTTGNKTFYAQWTAKTYTVTFNQNWATTNGATSVIATYDSPLPSIADNLPTKTGYRFEGYWDGENGTGTQYYKADGTSFRDWDKTSDCTLFAKWEQEIYTITLDNQGGDGITSVTTTYYAILPRVTPPTKIGYVFKGYNEKADGTGLMWYPETGICALVWNKTSDATLYAQWEERKLWISGNIATNQPMIHDLNTPEVYTYTTNAVNKTEGSSYYHFKFYKTENGIEENMAYGWSTIQKPLSTNNEDVVTGIKQDPGWNTNIVFSLTRKSDITITLTLQSDDDSTQPTVQIDANPYYTIKWMDENDNIVKEQELHAGETITPPADPSREGYTFAGWGSPQTMPADDVTYTAQWTINTYTITYGVFGGANGTIRLDGGNKENKYASTTAQYNTSHTLEAEPNNNETHKIGGWYSDANCANKIQAAGTTYTFTLTANTTVYVKFAEADEQMSNVYVSASSGGTVSQSGNVQVGNKTPSTFTATPNPGYRFDHWDATGYIVAPQDLTTATIRVTANGIGTLTAHFVRVYTVNYFATPLIAGSAAATVNSNPVSSGEEHDINTIITFTATINNTYNGHCQFVKWVNGAGKQLSTSATYNHTVTDDITVKAIFKISQHTLTFTAGDGGHVSAKANNSDIASPATLDYNTSVTLTATPNANGAFTGWYEGGTKKSDNTEYTFNLTDNKTLEARFTKGKTIFFKPSSNWKSDNAVFAIYTWATGKNDKWIGLEDYGCNGDIYTADIPAGYSNFKFVRLNPAKGAYSFGVDTCWAQGWDLTIKQDKPLYDMTQLYFKPNGWASDNARFAAYFFGNGEKWVDFSDSDGDGVYECILPTDKVYPNVILCRMNPNAAANNWNNKWNQTGDLTLEGGNYFEFTDDWGSGESPKSSVNQSWNVGYWTTYSAPKYSITLPKTTNGTIAVTYNGTTTTSKTNAVVTVSDVTLNDNVTVTFTPADGYELINYLVEYANETETPGVFKICGPAEISAEFAPIATSRTIYLRPNEDWQKDYPIIAAYAYDSKNDKNNKWYVMSTKPDDYTGAYSCKVENKYDCVVFVRLNQNGSQTDNGGLHWDNMWNQTKGLMILDKDNDANNDKKLRFAIGNKIEDANAGEDYGRYDGVWEENTPIWGLITNYNNWQAEKAIFMGYPGKLSQEPPFVPQHAFKLFNFFYAENSNYFGNSGTMQRANTEQWWTMDVNKQANCQMKLDAKGDYIYQLRFLTVGPELRKQISVTYPNADNVYYLMYKDNENKQRISYAIPAADNQLDTISFFVDVDKNPYIFLLDGNKSIVGEGFRIVATGGDDPGSAKLPGKRKAGELVYGNGCGVTESGVYNFVVTQESGNQTFEPTLTHAYNGNYYVRTDAATGGWNAYKQAGNQMTYSSYADKSHNYDHYFCKWVSNEDEHGNFVAYNNVKFCIANDYSHALSDELNGDELIDNHSIATGCIPQSANVRYSWDSKTNEVSRAYIAGSGLASHRFLVLTGNKYLKDIDGTALNVSGLKANEALFTDKQNWIYQLDVQANSNTDITLTAQYNNRIQTFFGTSKSIGGSDPIMQATNDDYHKVRMIYDFKNNNLIAAWLLDDEQDTEATSVASNMLIIRENQEQANQINFVNNQDVTIYTAYAVMTFTKDWVLDESKRSLSKWQRTDYWVSFPFDVNLSDVFGFGEYGDQWIMLYYDGAERAEKGGWKGTTYWKYITNRNEVLKAGVGYVLKLNPTKMEKQAFANNATDASLFFPSQGIPTIINHEPKDITVDEHTCTIERDNRNIYDSHWNLIGVPGFADLENLNVESLNRKVTISNKSHNLAFYYEYNAVNNTYNTSLATATFKNMYAYMVQYAGELEWTNLSTVPQQLAARRNSNSNKPEKLTLRLEIAQGEEIADQTFVQLQQEGATREFDMNIDLTKIINSGANIYTLVGNDRIQTAGNALPMEEVVVPVGVQIAADGEYTFRMPEGTEGMVVELVDYETYNRTNLLLSNYTVTLPKGTSENRFALHIQPQKDVVTGVENIGDGVNNGETVNKYLIDGKLIIRTADGVVYDAQGKRW